MFADGSNLFCDHGEPLDTMLRVPVPIAHHIE
jgi:hypothetical protein